jgi:hypothetical protein
VDGSRQAYRSLHVIRAHGRYELTLKEVKCLLSLSRYDNIVAGDRESLCVCACSSTTRRISATCIVTTRIILRLLKIKNSFIATDPCIRNINFLACYNRNHQQSRQHIDMNFHSLHKLLTRTIHGEEVIDLHVSS